MPNPKRPRTRLSPQQVISCDKKSRGPQGLKSQGWMALRHHQAPCLQQSNNSNQRSLSALNVADMFFFKQCSLHFKDDVHKYLHVKLFVTWIIVQQTVFDYQMAPHQNNLSNPFPSISNTSPNETKVYHKICSFWWSTYGEYFSAKSWGNQIINTCVLAHFQTQISSCWFLYLTYPDSSK